MQFKVSCLNRLKTLQDIQLNSRIYKNDLNAYCLSFRKIAPYVHAIYFNPTEL